MVKALAFRNQGHGFNISVQTIWNNTFVHIALLNFQLCCVYHAQNVYLQIRSLPTVYWENCNLRNFGVSKKKCRYANVFRKVSLLEPDHQLLHSRREDVWGFRQGKWSNLPAWLFQWSRRRRTMASLYHMTHWICNTKKNWSEGLR